MLEARIGVELASRDFKAVPTTLIRFEIGRSSIPRDDAGESQVATVLKRRVPLAHGARE